MPFIPHTEVEIQTMLATIGVATIEELFAEIPRTLKNVDWSAIPSGLNEMELNRLIQTRAQQNQLGCCFIGAGAYEHHIPAAVWEIASRGEFMTAYTPYQAEASQGTLQLIYEYQTMMCRLTGMDCANASLYDGASALAEALLMAVRANKKSQSKRFLIPQTLHPFYRQTLQTIVTQQGIELIEVPFNEHGVMATAALASWENTDICGLIIQQPNFLGGLESIDALTDWAHAQASFVIAVVNPTTLGVLKEPGQWGTRGADITCGEGQPLGIPLAGGGPYFGFMACKKEWVRQLPGRIVGRTLDKNGKTGFTLTLQAREQHIRRGKATSNICTNQGWLVTAATLYLSLLGPTGLQNVALASYHHAQQLAKQLSTLSGVDCLFRPFFHEFVIRLPRPVAEILPALAEHGIQGGFDLTPYYPALGHALLVCTTETKTQADLDDYQQQLSSLLAT